MYICYKNGNYIVWINPDTGTKMRHNPFTELEPDFSESCDVTITTKCDNGCKYCYLNCSPEGKHADFSKYQTLFDSLHPYTEFALNGNDLSHPDLVSFLKMLKKKHIFANLTVNQNHFMKHHKFLKELYRKKLIYGLGISYTSKNEMFMRYLHDFPTAVIHTINGITTPSDYEFLASHGENLKVLILGYKTIGRGESFRSNNSKEIQSNQQWLNDNIIKLGDRIHTISFDNLAITQLGMKEKIDPKEFKRSYMGDDGKYTFYIDLVNGYFAKDSLSEKHYPIDNKTIDQMFSIIKKDRYWKEK